MRKRKTTERLLPMKYARWRSGQKTMFLMIRISMETYRFGNSASGIGIVDGLTGGNYPDVEHFGNSASEAVRNDGTGTSKSGNNGFLRSTGGGREAENEYKDGQTRSTNR
jgi:hypothetical protein